MKLDIDKIENFLLFSFFPLYMLHMFLGMLGINLFITTFLYIFSIYYGVKVSIISSNFKYFKFLFTGYIIYNVLSIIHYSFNGIPLSVFGTDFLNVVYPMIFFYIGLNSQKTDNRFYIGILLGSLFCFIVGFYLHFSIPQWYLDWKVEQQNNMWSRKFGDVSEYGFLEMGRFSSFLASSYTTSTLSVIGLSISINYLFRRKKFYTYFFIFIVSVLAMFISMQRVGILYGLFVISLYNLYGIFCKKKNIKRFLLLEIFVIVICMVSLSMNNRNFQVFDAVSSKLTNTMIKDAFNERAGQYKNIMDNWKNYWFGDGLGSGGHAALKEGFVAVADGNYYKLLFETGIFGFIWFAFLMILTILKALKKYKYYSIELLIVLYYLAAMLGANILEFRFAVIPLWYCIGRIWNDKYLNNIIINQDHI